MVNDLRQPGDLGLPSTSQLYVGGVKIEDAAAKLVTRTSSNQPTSSSSRFWSSRPHPLNYPFSEGIVVNLAKKKKINYIALDLPHFPHHVYFHWWDDAKKDWIEFQGPSTGSIRIYIDGATPAVVGTAAAYQAKQHPSHYGAGHWLHYDIDIKPVTTSKIRIMGNRNFGSRKGGPKTPTGQDAKYSLGIQNLDFGWRVRTKQDVPRTLRDPDIMTEKQSFTQVIDLLGSPVELKLRENRAEDLLRGSMWRCEPQPVPYAVVNFFVDARDTQGGSQIIDRFNIVPVAAGASLNLYYSNEVPDADFGASDAPVIFPALRSAGEAEVKVEKSGIRFPDGIGYIDLTNQAVQWDLTRPFWTALEFQPQWPSTDLTPHIIFDTGALQLAWNNGLFQLTHNNGTLIQQPFEFSTNARIHAIISFDGERLSFYMPETGMVGNVFASMEEMASPTIRLGAEIGDSAAPVIFSGNYRLNAMLIKQEALVFEGGDTGTILPDAVRRFLDDPNVYLDKPEYALDDDGSTDNAILRYLPRFAGGTVNPHGFVGGPGSIYEDIVWTPVTRDYKMRAGVLQFMPVRAKFFKFEFSNLTPEPYQTFEPISRKVKTYSAAATLASSNPQRSVEPEQADLSPGLSSNSDAAQAVSRFADTPVLRSGEVGDVRPTEALHATNLGVQSKLDAMGSMYRFQSWQPNSASVRYPVTSKHVYEEVEVGHSKKIAYFVGISKLEMFRVDYTADDDTDQYLDLFDDTGNIDPEFLVENVVIGATNLVTNPSFEDGTTGHTLYTSGTATDGAITTVADGLFGPNALKVSASTLGASSTDRVGWQATFTSPDFGSSIAYSIYAKQVTGSGTVRLNVEYYDVGAVFISSDTESFTPGTDYERLTAIMMPPPDTESIKVHWWVEAGGGAAVEYRFDGYQIEDLRLTEYCDGTQPGCHWNGTANASTSTRDEISIRPWAWDGDKLVTAGSLDAPRTTTSRRFSSKRRVRGIQFATGQSSAVQLVPDPDFIDALIETWVPDGDVLSMELSDEASSTVGSAIRIHRSSSLNTWGELRTAYPTWEAIATIGGEQVTYSTVQGDASVAGGGGLKLRNPVQVSEAGRVYAAARVYADHTLTDPLTLQILSSSGEVLAEKTQPVQAGKIVEWSVGHTIGEVPAVVRTWGDIMRLDDSPSLPTYGDLEEFDSGRWDDLTSVEVTHSRQLNVRIVQQGSGEDTWFVDSLALFEDPILWEFSNDDGSTWWPALDIRNDPNGVLIFPNSLAPVPTDPTGLRWRVTGYRPNLHISALNVRPWYAETVFGIPHRQAGVSGGPNIQPTDHYAPVADDPMFRQWKGPIPQDWFFTYRQLLLIGREEVPVTPVIKPDTFANQHAVMVEIEVTPPEEPFQDLYTGSYSGIYGIPTQDAQGVYLDTYDPDNDF